MSITRYDWGETKMDENPKGDFVDYTDYQNEVDSLRDKIATLEKAIETAKEYLNV
jgi:hypothetical protein